VRQAHWLSSNSKSETVHAIIWTDTETKPIKRANGITAHKLRFGWACYQRTRTGTDWTEPEWYRYTTYVQFWNWLESKLRPKIRLHVFAHNWAFDGPVLSAFSELPRRGWQLKLAVIESPPVILTWRRDTMTVRMLDTLNWWRMPLAKIGEGLKLPKLPMPAMNASKRRWDTYARNDVEIIRRAILEWLAFLQDYDLGNFGPTLASQAMRAFRHRFMEHKILIDDNPHALQLARESLHGGRTEAFRIGKVKGPIYCLDVNSMYPAVMASCRFPTILRLHARRVTLSELKRWLIYYAAVARVRLYTKRNRYAYVHNGRLVFPTGKLRIVLTTPDLIDAFRHREVIAVEEAAIYEHEPIFAKFVREIYKLRQTAMREKKPVRVWLLKILLNSLYGKFAQRGETWETVEQIQDQTIASWKELDYESGRVYSYRRFAGQLQLKTVDPEAHDSHPAIAAHITAFARSRLWDLMQTAQPSTVYYCDTDSLFVNRVGMKRLRGRLDPTQLGSLKHEATFGWILIHGAKDYRMPGKRVTKGVRASATWITPNVVKQEQWSSLIGLLGGGNLSAPTTKVVQKTLSRVYEKGNVSSSGAVSPFVLSDW
jgi:DNA polymerase family B